MNMLTFLSSTFLRQEIAYIFIFLLIVSGILYLIKFIFNSVKTVKHISNVDYLLKNGKKIEIDLKKSVVSIIEDKKITEYNKSETFDKFVDNGFIDSKEKTQEIDYISYVKLIYTVDGKNYLHDIKLPMSMKSVEILFDFHKKTTLIYDSKNPENCIIDLGFAT